MLPLYHGRMLGDHVEFLRQFRTQFHTTGAIAPSGRQLARAMTRHLSPSGPPVRILEVGPGTGAVTRQIIRRMGTGDRLDLVEVNPTFAALLRRRLNSDPSFHGVADRTEVYTCGIESFVPGVQYEQIISGLPLNNFSAPFVEQVFESLFGLLAPNGILSYFEYMYVRSLKRIVASKDDRARLTALEAILSRTLANHRLATDWVMCNVPPAWVQHLRKR